MSALRSLIILILTLLSTHCVSISNNTNKIDEKKLDVPNKTTSQELKSNKSADNEAHWKKYFRSTPNEKEIKVLKKNIADNENKSISGLLKNARTYLALGNLNMASSVYLNIIKKENNNKSAMLEIAMIYLRKKQPYKAFEWLENLKPIIDDEKDSISSSFIYQYRYTLAMAYMEINNKTTARDILSDLVASDTSFIPGYTALASSYIEDEKLEIGKFIVQRALNSSKDDPAIYNLLGVISEKEGNFEKASKWYSKSLEISSNFVPALVNKSILEIKGYNYKIAEELLKKSLTLQSSNLEAHVGLAIIYIRQEKFDEAEVLLEKALTLDPQFAATRFNLGILKLHAFKQPYKALRLFYETIQSESGKTSSVLKSLARSYIEDIKNLNNINKFE